MFCTLALVAGSPEHICRYTHTMDILIHKHPKHVQTYFKTKDVYACMHTHAHTHTRTHTNTRTLNDKSCNGQLFQGHNCWKTYNTFWDFQSFVQQPIFLPISDGVFVASSCGSFVSEQLSCLRHSASSLSSDKLKLEKHYVACTL